MSKAFRSAKRHDDDDYVDEIRIKLVERYKTSDLSGDEWRFSAHIQFFRKGQLLHERALHDIKTALQYAPWALATAYEQDGWEYADDKDLCFQPGCTEKAVSEFELIEEFSPSGMKIDPSDSHGTYYRRFCAKHLTRGDCGREDSDSNYRIVHGPGPEGTDWRGANVTESAQVFVDANSIEDAPEAVRKAIQEFRGQ